MIWTRYSNQIKVGGIPLTDNRIEKFAQILIDYSTNVKENDKVAIITGTAATPLVQTLYSMILDRGAHPHILLEFEDQDEIFFSHANENQMDYVNEFYKYAFKKCDVLLKIRAQTNTRALSSVEPALQSRRQKALATLLNAQINRGADGELRWMSTLYPTQAFAIEAGMGFAEFQDFVYSACHADETSSDPVAYWQSVKQEQDKIIERIEGHDKVQVRGPNVDLTLSISGRIFKNACGENNMPDGEIYTGPVEDSANGWVRFSYPAVSQSRVVEGIELTFENGKVIKSTAEKNQDFLLKMLDTDPGASYLGEFAIGTNYQIDRAIKNILFDEKIGGSFHLAVGASYPETGGVNKSAVHWDMICDIQDDSEILVDGELVYQNGKFII